MKDLKTTNMVFLGNSLRTCVLKYLLWICKEWFTVSQTVWWYFQEISQTSQASIGQPQKPIIAAEEDEFSSDEDMQNKVIERKILIKGK